MFGAAKPTPSFGFTPAPTTGGFGAPAAPVTGFGAAPATNLVTGAAPATTGFSAAATTGFGAAPTTGFGTGFGAKPATTGFGAAPTTGFGAGFGAKPATTGFGSFGAAAQAAPPPNVINLQDFTRQSALASYLMELDYAYNALHRKCRFRAFVYNTCGPGQAVDAIQRERYVAFLNGGGCSEEEWMLAQQSNPHPQRMYPSPLHFSQELQIRGKQQKEAIQELIKVVDGYVEDINIIVALDRANQAEMQRLKQDGVMLERRWYAILQKIETIRQLGQSSTEVALLAQHVERLRKELAAPGKYRGMLQELQPFLDAAMATPTGSKVLSTNASSPPLLRPSVDPATMKGWLDFVGQVQDSTEDLHDLLDRDYKDMVAIRERVTAS